jgi:hypothetical protein
MQGGKPYQGDQPSSGRAIKTYLFQLTLGFASGSTVLPQ